ncbi:MAG TPA: DUF2167 domain-containing protein [Nevskiaceae bacterium]|nr:DUF2167 domain-containing protein [Nevskiaceae bacterium]
MKQKLAATLVALASLLVSLTLHAQDDGSSNNPGAAVLASLKKQTGEITLPNGIATLKLTDDFYFLDQANARKMLTEGWGNPPQAADRVLGMVLPAHANPLSRQGWGVVITYDEDGHVSDSDADTIDYAQMLKDMKQQAEDSNSARKQAGYPEVHLSGWAENPHYDPAAHKIYWAKDLQFADGPDHTLNYFVRVLGRKGVLELNAIAGMSQLPAVREDMKQVLALTEFTPGNRYNDFNSSTDKVAAYGLAALVAGGIAAKTGLLAKLGVLLLSLKKFVILIFAAIAGFFKKIFGGKKQ